MPLAVGTRLGPYEILSPLGHGGMGEVYRARDSRLNRVVALKVLPDSAAGDPERLARFEREARAVAALNHPHIVTIHSIETVEGVPLLTMEVVEGRALSDLIPPGGLALAEFLTIAIAVSEAVAAAHQKGITHRDLKPGNVMIGEREHEGRIKVLDFGLAKLAAAAHEPDATTMAVPAATGEGLILGTALRGLEQIRGAADAWASLHAGVYPERVEQLAGFEAGDRTWLAAGQPIDPWNNAYVVQFPTAKSEGRYLSLGSDRKPGGEGLAADIELP
jgi:serine/threonine protein kinase